MKYISSIPRLQIRTPFGGPGYTRRVIWEARCRWISVAGCRTRVVQWVFIWRCEFILLLRLWFTLAQNSITSYAYLLLFTNHNICRQAQASLIYLLLTYLHPIWLTVNQRNNATTATSSGVTISYILFFFYIPCAFFILVRLCVRLGCLNVG